MMYRANEKDIMTAVRDFDEMCEYLRKRRPAYTKGGALSSTGCYEVNELMTHKKTDAKEKDRMNTYPGIEGFLAPFLDCFPEGSIDVDTLNRLLFPEPEEISANEVYEFKVQLESDCYRVIQCSGNHTFSDLHLKIQEAFHFGNDHLYSFFMDGKRWSKKQINSPFGAEGPYADEVAIGHGGLCEKQTILYLFDYGDEWCFKVTVTSIFEVDSPLEFPVITQVKGEAPEQYSYEEEWDDE